MTIVRTIDQICEWLNKNVCPGILLKKPPSDKRQATNEKYEYELVNPYAFPLYVPTKDKLPPDVKVEVPSISVQLDYGSDTTDNRSMSINLGFASWNPGIHPDDWLIPEGTDSDYKEALSNAAEGWRDIYNAVDIVVTALGQSVYLGKDVEIDRTSSIEFGPYKEQDSIPSFYPYWFAYVTFKVRSSLRRNNQLIDQYL